VKIAEASAKKMDIFEYDIKSAGADDYLSFAKEILARTKPFIIESINEED
jgi:cellulose biosynthesis protein BcsQ